MEKQKGFLMPIVGVIVIATIAIIGYIAWQAQVKEDYLSQDAVTQEYAVQSTSTETEAIEEDLQATSFTSIDSDLSQIETELNTALSE